MSDLGLFLPVPLGGHHGHKFGGGGGSCHWQCIPLTLTFKCVTPRPCFGSHHFPRFIPSCVYSALPANGSPRSIDCQTFAMMFVVTQYASGNSLATRVSVRVHILSESEHYNAPFDSITVTGIPQAIAVGFIGVRCRTSRCCSETEIVELQYSIFTRTGDRLHCRFYLF